MRSVRAQQLAVEMERTLANQGVRPTAFSPIAREVIAELKPIAGVLGSVRGFLARILGLAGKIQKVADTIEWLEEFLDRNPEAEA